MFPLADLLASSSALVLLCMGVAVMLGVLHLWMSTRVGDANWWVAVWSGLSCVFLGARGVQLTTADPEAALLAGKIALSIGPYLVWALVGFGRNVGGNRLDRRTMGFFGGVSVAWTLAIVATPWFVEPEVTTRTDFFGHEHLSVHARWPTALLAAYFAGAVVWGLRRLRKQSRLEDSERRVLMFGFGVYAVLGVAAVLTSMSVLALPAMAEFGPVIVSVCLCHLMVRRRGRVEARLSALLEEKNSRLEASEERYRALLHHAPIGVLVCSADCEVVTINPRMLELLDSVGAPASTASLSDCIAGLGLASTIDEVLATGEVRRVEHRVPSGSMHQERIWHLTVSPAVDGATALVLADDVTERSQLERQLQQSQKMDSIGQLAAGIAHEINNPMAYVRANLGAMAELREDLAAESGGGLSAEGKSEVLRELSTLIDESVHGVERTISIVRDMREFSHSGNEPEPRTDLAQVLEACIRVAAVFDSSGVQIHVPELPDAEVAVGAGPIRQVFLNLLMNALQAVDGEGQIWIETRRVEARSLSVPGAVPEAAAGTPRPAIVVTIHDDGPGIPAAMRSRLFDPFFTTKAVGEGTGLGLYISYQIVRGCGGDIRAGDGPHGGASFEVELPLVTDGDGPEPS